MTGIVVWITGIPCSGKSTFAAALSERLRAAGETVVLLDGDEVRAVLNASTAYEGDARAAFYTTLARSAALLARQGMVVLVAATAHLRDFRELARRLAPRYIEVFVHASLRDAARRDSKGLYAAAQRGDIVHFPGMDAEYEPPYAPDITAEGGRDEAALRAIVEALTGEWRFAQRA